MTAAAPTRVVVVGQGYVGLPLALRAVDRGFDVTGLDLDPVRVEGLDAGRSFTEGVTDDQLAAAHATGRYRVTTDAATAYDGFDISVITVPTPLYEGVPDLSAIRAAVTEQAPHLRPGAMVVLESTTYPGTTEELMRPLLEQGSGLSAEHDFALGYSPERIDPGREHREFWHVPKAISGLGPHARQQVEKFYSALFDRVVPVSDPKVAELAKLLENTFRHVNIALVNELAMFAGDLGIDIWEAIEAASTKPYGFMVFTPGPGVGGHCLPVDPTYLSWQVERKLSTSFRFVDLANQINKHMPHYVINRIAFTLNERGRAIRGSRILALGLAYKPNVGDLRESASVTVTEQLLTLGAEVRVCEPHAGPSPVDDRAPRVALTEPEIHAADLVVVLTDHDAFDYAMIEAGAQQVLDTRHRVRGPQVEYL